MAAKLLGEYLREFTELTEEDLEEALQEQSELRKEGALTLIGDLLVSMGLVLPEEVAIALEQQARDRAGIPDEEKDLSRPVSEWGKNE